MVASCIVSELTEPPLEEFELELEEELLEEDEELEELELVDEVELVEVSPPHAAKLAAMIPRITPCNLFI